MSDKKLEIENMTPEEITARGRQVAMNIAGRAFNMAIAVIDTRGAIAAVKLSSNAKFMAAIANGDINAENMAAKLDEYLAMPNPLAALIDSAMEFGKVMAEVAAPEEKPKPTGREN